MLETLAVKGATQYAWEKMQVLVVPDDDYAETMARLMLEPIARNNRSGKPTNLMWSSGQTNLPSYHILGQLISAYGLDVSNIVLRMLDELLGISQRDERIYRNFALDFIVPQLGISSSQLIIPPSDLSEDLVNKWWREQDEIIKQTGLDQTNMGVGMIDNHTFGYLFKAKLTSSGIVTLPETTRRGLISEFHDYDLTPRKASTVGSEIILKYSDEILVGLTGEHKAPNTKAMVEGNFDINNPTTLLHGNPKVTAVIDTPSSSKLIREQQPWLVRNVNWEDPINRLKAMIYLSETEKKPFCDLRETDFENYKLHRLIDGKSTDFLVDESLTTFARIIGAIGEEFTNMNIGLTSPHQDDLTISMGHTYWYLGHSLGNKLTSLILTDGYNSVRDESVFEFIRRRGQVSQDLLEFYELKDSRNARIIADGFLKLKHSKKHGLLDIPAVLAIKTQIRNNEFAHESRCYGADSFYLRLPFYRTGRHIKLPISEKDIEITHSNLLHYDAIAYADDRDDPHGTHRLCSKIIEQAIHRMDRRPRIIKYGGSWNEFPLYEANAIELMTEKDLAIKLGRITAIFSSQNPPPLPGFDNRPYHIRAEERNRNTVTRLKSFGVPGLEGYVAAEVFKLS